MVLIMLHRTTSQIIVPLFHKGFTSFKGKIKQAGVHWQGTAVTSPRGDKPLQWIPQLRPHWNVSVHWLQKFPQSSGFGA